MNEIFPPERIEAHGTEYVRADLFAVALRKEQFTRLRDVKALSKQFESVLCQAAAEIERLTTALSASEAAREKDADLYRRVIDDVFDDMDCDPECDSNGHTETCCATYGPAAVAKLRALLSERQRQEGDSK